MSLKQEGGKKTIAIIAVGSRGDVQPYIALAQGLQRAGHVVRLVMNKEFETLAGSYGVEVCPVDINAQAALQAPDASAAIERGGLLTSFRKLAEIARSGTRLLFQAALEAARQSDLLVAGFSGMLVAGSLVEKLGIPFVQAYNVPFTPTGAYPGALVPWLSFPPRALAHRVGHQITRQFVWQAARSTGNGPRVEMLGLRPAPLTGFFDSPAFGGTPLLYGFSPAVLPPDPQWDERIHVTGFWFAGEPLGWAPPPELLDFLDAGPAPVYVGFGSMSSEKPGELTSLVLDALARHGRRAVLHAGWAGLAAESVPPNVHVVGSVPHAWLFPRMSAIVHHGGAGTTAAAIRAGAPQVVVPFHGDQPFWARLTERAGVGTQPVPRSRLTAKRLAVAIEQALTSETMGRRAADLGAQVRQEDGVGRAVELIEAVGR